MEYISRRGLEATSVVKSPGGLDILAKSSEHPEGGGSKKSRTGCKSLVFATEDHSECDVEMDVGEWGNGEWGSVYSTNQTVVAL